MTSPLPPPRAVRRDAVRNQQLVLDAARGVLSEHGTDATMELIASRAGVGVGTVYRHFPNKDALVDALVAAIYDRLIAAATAALGHGGTGLDEFLRVLGRSFAEHRGYARMLVGHSRGEAGAKTLRAMIGKLLAQAKEADDIGVDVTLGDIMTAIWAIRGVVETSGAVAEGAWERHLDIHLAALRANAVDSTQPSITARQLGRISARADERRAGTQPSRTASRSARIRSGVSVGS
jgi:AcrR family transcriptional regulator